MSKAKTSKTDYPAPQQLLDADFALRGRAQVTTKIDLEDLERKATVALGEHPWRVYRCHSADDGLACGIKDQSFVSDDEDACQIGVIVDTNRDECHHAIALEDAEHIAANSPPVTLALIARIRELEAAMMRAGHAFAGILPAPDVQQFIALIERGVVLA